MTAAEPGSPRDVGAVFLKGLGPFRGRAAFVFALTFAAALAESLSLGFVFPFLEAVLAPGRAPASPVLASIVARVPEGERLLWASAVLVGLVVVRTVLVVWREIATNRFVNTLRLDWSRSILDRVLSGPFDVAARRARGALLNDVLHEPTYASKAYRDVADLCVRLLLGLLTVAVLTLIDWRLAASALAVGVVLAAAVWGVSRRYSLRVGRERIELQQDISATMGEALAGLRQVKVFSMESQVSRETGDRVERLVRAIEGFRLAAKMPLLAVEPLVFVLLVGVLLVRYSSGGVDASEALPGLVVFLLGAQRLFGVLSELLSARMSILSYLPSLRLVIRLREEGAGVERDGEQGEAPALERELRFEDVGFSYPGAETPVFQNFSATVMAGDVTLVVGESGAGKSTFCDLLVRLLEPDSGRILADGADIGACPARWWRSQTGYASQETFLFATSVRDNIRIGARGATDADVEEAARLADADSFIRELPLGYDTVLGESGAGLSGGQRQRIALARALIRRPRLLILDEVTSALDEESESRILETISGLAAGRVVVLVSHRAAARRCATRVLRFARSGAGATLAVEGRARQDA